MFKRSNEELRRLEQQLLAVEEPQVEEEDFDLLFEELLEEFGPEQEAETPKKKTHRKNSDPVYTYTDHAEPPHRKKRRSIRGLLVTLALECLGIVGVLLWWMLRIL
jgi:hypothetical protein